MSSGQVLAAKKAIEAIEASVDALDAFLPARQWNYAFGTAITSKAPTVHLSLALRISLA